MYKHLFFDLDGTLINSYPRTLNAIKKIIKKHLGIDVSYEELFIDAMVDLGHLFRKYGFPPSIFDELEEIFASDTSLPELEAFESVNEVLEFVKERGMKCYIYTNRNELTYKFLKDAGIDHYFTSYLLEAGKPSSQSLIDFLLDNKISPKECLVIGDRLLDIEGANGAGVDAFAINDYKKEEGAFFQGENARVLLKFLKIKKINNVYVCMRNDFSKNRMNRLFTLLQNKGINSKYLRIKEFSYQEEDSILISDNREILDKASTLNYITCGINDTFSYNKANIVIKEEKDLLLLIDKLNFLGE
ncbi:MAG: HAD family hydrolase [Bacilli bacterium]